MIRLKARVHHKTFNGFVKNENYEWDVGIHYWHGPGIKDYKHNFKFQDIKGSFWMGYHHQSEKLTKVHYLVIEFNPNKVQNSEYLKPILKFFFSGSFEYEISSCDIAVDLFNI